MKHQDGYDRSAKFYDMFDNKDNIKFFIKLAEKLDKVLDIGAGTGRIAIPLAEEGIDVVCVEPSEPMLNEFYEKISDDESLAKRIKIINDDAKDFEIDDEFRLAVMSGMFDHLLTEQDILCVLLNINKHLEIGGKLVFDVFLGLMKEKYSFEPAGSVEKGGKEYRRFIRSEKVGEDKIKTILRYDIFEDGDLIESVKQESMVGVIDRNELHRYLLETGFEIENEYSDYDFKPYEKGDEVCIIEAVKKE